MEYEPSNGGEWEYQTLEEDTSGLDVLGLIDCLVDGKFQHGFLMILIRPFTIDSEFPVHLRKLHLKLRNAKYFNYQRFIFILD